MYPPQTPDRPPGHRCCDRGGDPDEDQPQIAAGALVPPDREVEDPHPGNGAAAHDRRQGIPDARRRQRQPGEHQPRPRSSGALEGQAGDQQQEEAGGVIGPGGQQDAGQEGGTASREEQGLGGEQSSGHDHGHRPGPTPEPATRHPHAGQDDTGAEQARGLVLDRRGQTLEPLQEGQQGELVGEEAVGGERPAAQQEVAVGHGPALQHRAGLVRVERHLPAEPPDGDREQETEESGAGGGGGPARAVVVFPGGFHVGAV